MKLIRSARFEKLFETPIDVMVIGGGIVGAGIARDAAMRGLRVVLVDQHDFAFGTSSRSSRLLHGGLRYLAQGRLKLVREASIEKGVIHRIAPHLAVPLPFVFPTRSSGPWKLWKLRIGVKLYDRLCRGRNLGDSKALSRHETTQNVPGINPIGLTGSVLYFDAMTNDARLVIDTLRSAESHGAVVQNYCKLHSATRSADVWRCELVDPHDGRTISITAKTIVNAAGSWADTFAASAAKLRLTKGVHLVVDRSRLPVNHAIVMSDGSRILFAIPWGERVILGTTDTDFDGDRHSPECDAVDIEYILRIVNSSFPKANIVFSDIMSTWAGLRPLIQDRNGGPSDISRRHQVRMTEPGWFDVTGGKLTTYRLMGEECMNQVERFLGHTTSVCRTADEPLVVAKLASPFSGILPPEVTREAVSHFCKNEWAIHLDDVMVRRTSWRYYHRNHLEIAETVAEWMASFLGWSDDMIREELQNYHSA